MPRTSYCPRISKTQCISNSRELFKNCLSSFSGTLDSASRKALVWPGWLHDVSRKAQFCVWRCEVQPSDCYIRWSLSLTLAFGIQRMHTPGCRFSCTMLRYRSISQCLSTMQPLPGGAVAAFSFFRIDKTFLPGRIRDGQDQQLSRKSRM